MEEAREEPSKRAEVYLKLRCVFVFVAFFLLRYGKEPKASAKPTQNSTNTVGQTVMAPGCKAAYVWLVKTLTIGGHDGTAVLETTQWRRIARQSHSYGLAYRQRIESHPLAS